MFEPVFPTYYGPCRNCGCQIWSGDTFASIVKDGKVIALECETCMDEEEKDPEVIEGGRMGNKRLG